MIDLLISSDRALSFKDWMRRLRRLSSRLTSLKQPRSRMDSCSSSGGIAALRLLGT